MIVGHTDVSKCAMGQSQVMGRCCTTALPSKAEVKRAVRPPNPHITPPVLAPRSNAASGRARSRPRNTGCVIQARLPLVSIDLKRIAQRRRRQFAVRALSERVSVVPASVPLPNARNERLYAWVMRPALAGVVAHCRKAIQPWDMWIVPHMGD
jgi:hypothetical protein